MTKPVKVNRANWSAASKRSMAFEFHPETYRDIEYKCSRCKRDAVFSAKEQQETFEVRKAYVWQRRALCLDCAAKRFKLEEDVKAFRARWKRERKVLKSDVKALSRWQHALLEIPLYGGRSDPAQVAMIERLLASAGAAADPGSKR